MLLNSTYNATEKRTRYRFARDKSQEFLLSAISLKMLVLHWCSRIYVFSAKLFYVIFKVPHFTKVSKSGDCERILPFECLFQRNSNVQTLFACWPIAEQTSTFFPERFTFKKCLPHNERLIKRGILNLTRLFVFKWYKYLFLWFALHKQAKSDFSKASAIPKGCRIKSIPDYNLGELNKRPTLSHKELINVTRPIDYRYVILWS